MLSYDVDFSVNMHFEIDEDEALDRGGVDLSLVKQQIKELPDWVLTALNEYIDFGEHDSINVIPYEFKLMQDGKVINLDEIPDLPNENEKGNKEIDEETRDENEV